VIRTLYAKLITLFATVYYGSRVIVAQRLGDRYGRGTILDVAPHRWARMIARAARMQVVTHGADAIDLAEPHVFVVNHVSIMDIPAVLHAVPDSGFVAKHELSTVPLFGAAANAVGVVFIDRENRKLAFAAYEDAADTVRRGRSVIVFPEGTRGNDYTLRPFKKGPFVLAIRSGVPIIPVIIHGTIEVTPNGTLDVTPGVVNVHLLAPIVTAGLGYADRNPLADRVHASMSDAMHRLYGVARPVSHAAPVRSPLPADSGARRRTDSPPDATASHSFT